MPRSSSAEAQQHRAGCHGNRKRCLIRRRERELNRVAPVPFPLRHTATLKTVADAGFRANLQTGAAAGFNLKSRSAGLGDGRGLMIVC